ncbi:NPCBM/NEW2 domain-containing protein [Streptomyces sp. Vc74B-19]|uniref:NPCBM/NEW2 domain-containing protein n=1 Tax=unclassified Streptomyces TaxID=2593676 RepID=UPI001BFC0574|nr:MULTISPECIES: NPCBM/NEW2 domain-containing protein [unclassified Streptomyces]MBT3164392.1 NPCBM/NEW2 domain-containing protein [Streptomyces sp. Vc74B-19]MDU0305215.1 NPCBM/NEW2 domain-containing protein [Streptomyces sp. PAL114]
MFAALVLVASGASGCSKETNNCRERSVCGEDNDSNGLSDEAAGSVDGPGEDPSADSADPADFAESPDPTSTDQEQTAEPFPDEESAGDGPGGAEKSPSKDGETPQQGPRTLFLSDARPIEKNVGEGTTEIAGTTYTSSIWKDIGPSSNLNSVYVVYALNADWTTFTAEVGPDSDSRSDVVVDFEVYLDDRKLGDTHRTTVTESARIEENVTGGIQLRLVAKYVSGSKSGAYSGQAAWGSAHLE